MHISYIYYIQNYMPYMYIALKYRYLQLIYTLYNVYIWREMYATVFLVILTQEIMYCLLLNYFSQSLYFICFTDWLPKEALLFKEVFDFPD